MGELSVPKTLEQALDAAWLSDVLDVPVVKVNTVEVIRTVATKVRFRLDLERGLKLNLCLKGLLDVDDLTARGGPTMVREADFYGQVAGQMDVRVPTCFTTLIDREAQQAVVIMRDLIADGVSFCSALQAFSSDEAADSLAQLARLHNAKALLDTLPWITRRIAELAKADYISAERIQELLDGPRGVTLDANVRNAKRLVAGMQALAAVDAARPQFLVHGDAHAGNIFRNHKGAPGLIDWQLLQRGGWALDVAYHIAAVLPVDVAEREERALLGHYLAVMRGFGHIMPSDEEAWIQYRESLVYGYYLWSITQRVDPEIITVFSARLGAAVARHDSFGMLGV
ncbi:MAG: hypothetical protein RLY97_1581 [Pseudomonadota bacterium]